MSSVLGEKISLVHCFVNSSSTEAGGVVNKSVCTSVCDNMYVVLSPLFYRRREGETMKRVRL